MTTSLKQPDQPAEIGPVLHMSPRSHRENPAARRIPIPLRRVLIVDFRDEVYACLRSEFRHLNVRVARAASADEAFHVACRFAPQLVLVNAHMPDESGWLICAKNRLCHDDFQVWVYVPRIPLCPSVLKEATQADAVIEYGGVLFRLIDRVRWALKRCGRSSASAPTGLPLRGCFQFDAADDVSAVLQPFRISEEPRLVACGQ